MVLLERDRAQQPKVVWLPKTESVEGVRERWQALVERVPLLGARVTGSGEDLAFAAGPAPAPVPVRGSSLSPVKILERALDARINARQGPLAHAELFLGDRAGSGRGCLLVQVHHCIADGAARDELCRAVVGRGRRLTSAYWDGLGPAEDCVGPEDGDDRARLIDAFVRRQLELGAEPTMHFTASSGADGRASGVIPVALPVGYRVLAETARRHKASMHGAVGASLLMASFPTLRDHSGAPPDASVILMSSSRPRLRNGRVAPFGMFGSGIRTRHRLSARAEFWTLARHVYSSVRNARARQEDVAALHLQHLARRSTDPPRAIAPLWLTTLRWNCAARAIGGVSVHGQGPMIYCGAVIGVRETLLNFVYSKQFMEPTTVRAIAERTAATLCRAVDAPTSPALVT